MNVLSRLPAAAAIACMVSIATFIIGVEHFKTVTNDGSVYTSVGTVALRQYVPLGTVMIPPFINKESEHPLPVNSAPGVTGSGIPFAMKKILLETKEEIQEDAETFFAAEAAVNSLEEKCKWIPEETSFQDKSCFDSVKFDKKRQPFFADPSLIDIVTPSIRSLVFLNEWREFFQGFHIIVIQDGDPTVHLEIPQWVDYELYNRNDIKEALGEEDWIISSKDASIRNFGFMVSKKPYIYTIDDDCLPAKDKYGNIVNPIASHLQNLMAPANPYFFNTLYDPFATNSDFVRGYPYSLRAGVPTAISHGLWLFTPDYDAPTQLLKPEERNSNYLDMVQTIPHKILYPMCSMNVAFSRELIGPAFMQGLMGEGQPWARYDDMFAGWASKVVADHLGVGVKSGKPYIYHNTLSNPFINLKKEYKGLDWQEEMIRFFANEVSFSKEANTPIKAYVELANQIKKRFRQTNKYFERMGDSMIIWTKIWDQVAEGVIQPIPSRVSDSLIPKQYPPINLGITGGSMNSLSDDDILQLFPFLGKDRHLTVTVNDILIGHRWKTYLFPIDKKFNEDSVLTYIDSRGGVDCITQICDLEFLGKGGFQYTDYMAEVIIFKKLLASLNFVKDIKDADLVLVPLLGVSSVINGCRNGGRCRNEWFLDLNTEIEQKSNSSKKHLYLASQDSSQNHNVVRTWAQSQNNMVVNYGPQGFVVPSLNSDVSLQPSYWKGCTPLDERKHFLLAGFGARGHLKDRATIQKQVDAYNGTKSVEGHGDLNHALTSDSVMTICPPGDLPFQKRFFDTILSCSIPVVVMREVEGIGKTYWSNVNFQGHKMFSVEDSYPKLDFPYSDIVVEIDGRVLESGGMMEYLEDLPQEVLESKLKKIEQVRNSFVYDFYGTVPDAFSNMIMALSSFVTLN